MVVLWQHKIDRYGSTLQPNVEVSDHRVMFCPLNILRKSIHAQALQELRALSMANGDHGIQVVRRTRGAPCSQGQRSHQAITKGERVQRAKEILEGFFEQMGISGGHARDPSVRVGEMNECGPRLKRYCMQV